MISWPTSYLPLPSQDVTKNTANNIIQTTMETGRIRQRRRQAARTEELAVTWSFSPEQFSLFESFVEQGLSGGVAEFSLLIPFHASSTALTVRLSAGEYTSVVDSSGFWRVSATLLVTLKASNNDYSIFDLLTSIDDPTVDIANLFLDFHTLILTIPDGYPSDD